MGNLCISRRKSSASFSADGEDGHEDVYFENPADRKTSLLDACIRGKEDLALHLMKNVEDIDLQATDSNGNDAFFWALKNGLKTEIIEALVDKNAAWRKNAFLEACKAGNEDFAVKFLRIDGVDLNATDSEGRTPFYWACLYSSFTKVVQALVDEPIFSIDFNRQTLGGLYTGVGQTGFHQACYYNHIEMVKILVQNSKRLGINLNVQCADFGNSGLMLACQNKRHEVVEFLWDNSQNYNIDLDLKNKWNESAKDIWSQKFNNSGDMLRGFDYTLNLTREQRARGED